MQRATETNFAIRHTMTNSSSKQQQNYIARIYKYIELVPERKSTFHLQAFAPRFLRVSNTKIGKAVLRKVMKKRTGGLLIFH